MHILENIKTANKLINTTEKVINVYDGSSGDIITLNPKTKKLPEEPNNKDALLEIFYILKRETADRLTKLGRPLDDIAVIRGTGVGRDETEITYFNWGGDIRKEVRLYCR